MRRRKTPRDTVKIRGFVRLELIDVRGKHAGRRQRTPWMPNVVTAQGFQDYLVGVLGVLGGSKLITHMAVGTQTDAPVSTQDLASGEFGNREAVTKSFIADGTLRVTASWATDEITASNLGAVALHNTSTASGGTAASIAIFASSAKTTDQEFKASYDWQFS